VGTLDKLRQNDSDTAAPTGVVARSRGAVRTLTEIAQNLPDGDARRLIATVLNSQVAPPEASGDKLFRLLTQLAVTGEWKGTPNEALGAHGAVNEIRRAFLLMNPESPEALAELSASSPF
jgi:hypothetical protein